MRTISAEAAAALDGCAGGAGAEGKIRGRVKKLESTPSRAGAAEEAAGGAEFAAADSGSATAPPRRQMRQQRLGRAEQWQAA